MYKVIKATDCGRENIPLAFTNFFVDPSTRILERKCSFMHSFPECLLWTGPELGDTHSKERHALYP